jgi:transcriptional regulator with XRE-family HTH domain
MSFDRMTDDAMAAEIGSRIEQLRLEKNLTQQQVADAIGISRVSYGKLVRGQGKFTNVIAVLRVLGQLTPAGVGCRTDRAQKRRSTAGG